MQRFIWATILASRLGLESLDLSANNLNALPAGFFSELAALRVLRLAKNNLTSLDVRLFDGLGKLEVSAASARIYTQTSERAAERQSARAFDDFTVSLSTALDVAIMTPPLMKSHNARARKRARSRHPADLRQATNDESGAVASASAFDFWRVARRARRDLRYGGCPKLERARI